MEIQDDWNVDVPEEAMADLSRYAQEHGLSIEEALLRLAGTQLDMRSLGRRLGAEGLSKPPTNR